MKTSLHSGEGTVLAVEDCIRNLCSGAVETKGPLAAALDHHLAAGGQRTRTQLSLACSGALELPTEDGIALAAAVECLHNASLIQDDLQDRSTLRRGKAAVWHAFGSDTALCLTDWLLSATFAALANVGVPDRIPVLLQHTHAAIGTILRGQVEDTTALRERVSVEKSVETAAAKSSPFFALSLELPLLLARYQDPVRKAGKACRHFGIGYQIFDDLQDLEQDQFEGNLTNIVLAFGDPDSVRPPLVQATNLALHHLAEAKRLAVMLPCGCGCALGRMAESLQDKLLAMK